MPTEAVREIAKKGGQSSHEEREGKRKAHEWTTEEAKSAGRKGGLANGEYHKRRKAQDSNLQPFRATP